MAQGNSSLRALTKNSYHVYFTRRLLLLWLLASAVKQWHDFFYFLLVNFRAHLSLAVHLLVVCRALAK